MIFPIKFKFLGKEQASLHDIISSNPAKKLKCLNAIRVGKTFKTTSPNRFPLTINFLAKKNNFYKIIHDIGCSDGTSSLDLMKKVDFGSFFCMDKFVRLSLGFYKSNPFLVDDHNNVHMYENKFAMFYLDPFKVHSSPFEFLISKFFFNKFNKCTELKIVEMINPQLTKYPNVYIQNFDIFEDELARKSDLILVFNLLNKFENKIYREKCKFFFEKNLNHRGLVVVGENQPYERASIYEKNKSLNLVKTINGGSSFKI